MKQAGIYPIFVTQTTTMKKYFLSISALFITAFSFAEEGMWLPQLLQTLNEKQMKKMGLKLTAADIYSVNKSSLKDAIVSFGGFCTGEVISSEGLILTNHHCGFDAIQNHSSIQNNYIRDGFWAYNKTQELPNPGLFATFIVSINEVTKEITAGTEGIADEKERQSKIDANLAALKKSFKRESYQEVLIRPFFEGNKYFLFVTETYNDVRLVGAPPSSIGNYGKDTDNWMWPRHTGDFSMFRIYAGKDNKPAAYSLDNVPFKPKRSLNISLKGVKAGDFTMVFGFPGRTNEYLHSSAVKQIVAYTDPAKIAIRAKALNVIDGFMRKDETVKIKYAAKYASIQNAYKKWQGEVLGLTRTNGVAKKQEFEKVFERIVLARPEMNAAYLNLLKQLESTQQDILLFVLARDNYAEITQKIELFTIVQQLNGLINAYVKGGITAYAERLPKTIEALKGIFGEYDAKVDQQLFEQLMPMYLAGQQEAAQSQVLLSKLTSNNMTSFANQLYSESPLVKENKLMALLNGNNIAGAIDAIKNDEGFILCSDIANTYQEKVVPTLSATQNKLNGLQRTYMQAQMDVFVDKPFYPDANSTLRLTYGNVKPYQPRDGVQYDFYTYLDGVLEKYVPGDYEYDLPAKILELHKNKDYGRWAVNGKQPVCFIAANHTTGGNSGSPALDASGNLVGLNFDRVWEGTMSDINYDPSICRNIMVDIRYVMFIVDKFANAQNIIKELKFVK